MSYTDHQKFTGRNVPIAEIARATGKNPQFIRIGLQRGILPFGIAMKNEGSSEYTYYCSDKLVWEAKPLVKIPQRKEKISESKNIPLSGQGQSFPQQPYIQA